MTTTIKEHNCVSQHAPGTFGAVVLYNDKYTHSILKTFSLIDKATFNLICISLYISLFSRIILSKDIPRRYLENMCDKYDFTILMHFPLFMFCLHMLECLLFLYYHIRINTEMIMIKCEFKKADESREGTNPNYVLELKVLNPKDKLE
ncbi:hypothetical protein RF11_06496 [Thelohanellus kitauei]|uniref:Uncharacterized protein n=1 Tax=Thelohanellus kitauei TaxID=669202 RepID=A0A0C2JZU2_THEKT|nr:hypothetical protein RF11_06496 [Thelohanellus kitauei]